MCEFSNRCNPQGVQKMCHLSISWTPADIVSFFNRLLKYSVGQSCTELLIPKVALNTYSRTIKLMALHICSAKNIWGKRTWSISLQLVKPLAGNPIPPICTVVVISASPFDHLNFYGDDHLQPPSPFVLITCGYVIEMCLIKGTEIETK
jgi:hypothetical protein